MIEGEEGSYQASRSPSNKQGRSAMKNTVNSNSRDEMMEGGVASFNNIISKKIGSKSKMTQRLIHRNLPFCQSKNFVNVTNQYGKHRDDVYKLFRLDWFHVFLRLNTMLSVTILLLIWTVQILIFAALYVAVDGQNPRSVTAVLIKIDMTSYSFFFAVGPRFTEGIFFSFFFGFGLSTVTALIAV